MADYGLDTTREGAGLNYCGLRKNARDLRRSLKKKRDKKVPLQDNTLHASRNAELRAAFKEDPSSLSADDRARAEQLLARDARKAAKKAARRVSSETPPSPPPSESV